MKLIDKDKVVAEIEGRIEAHKETLKNCDSSVSEMVLKGSMSAYQSLLHFFNTLEVKDVIAEQECTCNEALNRIIGGTWNLLCPVNKLGLKTDDKVKVIIEAQKGE